MNLQITCGYCRKVIEFSRERPAFCGYCGRPLTDAGDFLAETLPGPPPSAPSPSSQAPQTIGQYRLLRELGQGGMGVVWEAEQAGTGRRVALKLLFPPRLPRTPETVERFLREGRLAASLSHPRSTFVFEAGQHGDQPYIVMELMPGRTLKDLVQQEGRLPAGRAVDYILEAIEGLEAAHELGIIHRDVKPSNCFLDADGRVKVGDFGLSKSLVHSAALTRTGAFLGTPEFAAPEQVRAGTLDQRTDVYAVGATLFFLTAGRGPFQGDAASVIAQIASDPAPRLRELCPQTPAGLDAAIARTLEKDPSRRFANLGELRQALQPFSSGGTTIADVGRRLAAYALDTVVYALAAVAMWLIVQVVVSLAGRGVGNSTLSATMQSARVWEFLPWAFLLGHMAYHLIGETWWGCTLGKRWLGLRVDAAQGGAAGLRRCCVRTLFLPGSVGLSALALICLAVFLPAVVPAKASSGTAAKTRGGRTGPAISKGSTAPPIGKRPSNASPAKPAQAKGTTPPANGAPTVKGVSPPQEPKPATLPPSKPHSKLPPSKGSVARPTGRQSTRPRVVLAPVVPPLRRPLTWLALLVPVYLMGALSAITMRSRNGYRGLHDLASGTSVVRVTPMFAIGRRLETPVKLASAAEDEGRAFGPFRVAGEVGQSNGATVLLGRDEALSRAVWIYVSPPDLPPPPPARLAVTRSTRPRWLQGGNHSVSPDAVTTVHGEREPAPPEHWPQEHWDAYEAVTGAPLAEVAAHSSGFDGQLGRRLVLELAEELAAAAIDGTLPATLSLDQVWIDRGGCVKLLDWPVHRLAGLGRSRASRIGLRPRALPSRSASRADANPLFGKSVSRRRPTPPKPAVLLSKGPASNAPASDGPSQAPNVFQSAVELLLAAFALGARKGFLSAGDREVMDELSKRVPNPETLAWAAERLRSARTQADALSSADRLAMLGVSLAAEVPLYLLIAFLLIGGAWQVADMDELFYVALPWLVVLALPASLAFRFQGGPVFKLLGVEVRSENRRAARWRCAWRDLLAWAPGMMALCALAYSIISEYSLFGAEGQDTALNFYQFVAWGGLCFAPLVLPGAVFSILRPQGGLQDILSGTRLAPRRNPASVGGVQPGLQPIPSGSG